MEYDKAFTLEDRESLAEFLGKPSLPTPHMALEEAGALLISHGQETSIKNESFAVTLPHGLYGALTENLLIEDIFEGFFAVKRPEENNSQRGEGFLAFVNEWRENAEKRFNENNNPSSNFALWLVGQITPESIHVYAFNKWNKVDGDARALKLDNPDRSNIEEKLNRWRLYEGTAWAASREQDKINRTLLPSQRSIR